MKKLLVTFGCSWTWGAGCFLPPEKDINDGRGFDEEDYENFRNNYAKKLVEIHSFRARLCKKHGYENRNFSGQGSSNQRNFRLAEKYFNTDDYKNYDKVIVLWGITSTARGEFWYGDHPSIKKFKRNSYKSIQYARTDVDLANFMRERHYNHDVEVERLGECIKHWDKYFKFIGVENHWFDTFNHHDYPEVSDNMIGKDDKKRDLLSKLCEQEGMTVRDDSYHFSIWREDCDRIEYLLDKQVVNQISHHPNQKGHQMIADILDKEILW